MDVYEAVQAKRAIRQYQDGPLTDEHTRRILNAGRLAQSAKNLQPWDFIAVRDRNHLMQLADVGRFSDHLGTAGLGIVIVTPDPSQRFQILFDAGQSAAYMQLVAWEMGIVSCLVTSFAREAAREYLRIPEDRHIRIAIAFGYPVDDPTKRTPRPGGRRSFADVVHWETW